LGRNARPCGCDFYCARWEDIAAMALKKQGRFATMSPQTMCFIKDRILFQWVRCVELGSSLGSCICGSNFFILRLLCQLSSLPNISLFSSLSSRIMPRFQCFVPLPLPSFSVKWKRRSVMQTDDRVWSVWDFSVFKQLPCPTKSDFQLLTLWKLRDDQPAFYVLAPAHKRMRWANGSACAFFRLLHYPVNFIGACSRAKEISTPCQSF